MMRADRIKLREMWRCGDCKNLENGICQVRNAPRDGNDFNCSHFNSRTMEKYFRISEENMRKHDNGK